MYLIYVGTATPVTVAFRLFFFFPRTNPGWRIRGGVERSTNPRRVQEIKGTAEEEILRAFVQEGGSSWFRVEMWCWFLLSGEVSLFGEEKQHNKFLYV